ncbi:MAG: hypothetical protein IKV65_03150 [Erysipelotrichaceae bacterium]|nr:hypothetical protein [Erysipelotrichaceae bacterium]
MRDNIRFSIAYYSEESKKKELTEIEKIKGVLLPGVELTITDLEEFGLLGILINYDTFGAKRAKSRNAGPKEKNVIYYPDTKENQRVVFTYKRYFELSKTMSDIEIIKHLNINKATFYRRKKKMLKDIEYAREVVPEYNEFEDDASF